MPRSALTATLAAGLLLFFSRTGAAEISPQELEDWFNGTGTHSAASVNEGELVFLPGKPDKPVHHHHNFLAIVPSSLEDGWATLVQCHENLDRVGRTQIVFNREKIRGIRIQSYSGIEKAWVEGASVQLENIGPGAMLCLSAESRALIPNGDGSWSLRNGPFMRKFLDGYYPMHVSMKIAFPETIRPAEISPAPNEGLRVWRMGNTLHLDAWFEGRLNTEIRFRAVP